jgi:predicted nucleotidyltransferase
VRRWAAELARNRQDVLRVGYFGSYARGDWGPGSDVDLVVIVCESPVPFERRAAQIDATRLPVPADLLVYTRQEWQALRRRSPQFASVLRRETVWVFRRYRLGKPRRPRTNKISPGYS